MAIDVTYTFVAMTIARASEVNQNFTDLRDSIRGAHHQDADGTKLVNADLDASAAVVYSKLSLSDSIVNADINTSAAIAWTKISKSGSVFNDLGDVTITGAASQDILHRDGSSKWVNLAKGSDGDVLSMVAGLLTWQAPSFAHNDASGLQGGTSAEYYHLTSAQHTNVTGTLLGGASTDASALHCHPLDSGDFKFGVDQWGPTGNGQTKVVTHNLGVVPSLIILDAVAGAAARGNSQAIYDGSSYAILYRYQAGASATYSCAQGTTKIIRVFTQAYAGEDWSATITTNGTNSFTMTSDSYSATQGVFFQWRVYR
jgi:hypothetical protein